MVSLDLDSLCFPTGISVRQLKKRARKRVRDEKITHTEALNRLARENGIDLPWDQAVKRLESARPAAGLLADDSAPESEALRAARRLFVEADARQAPYLHLRINADGANLLFRVEENLERIRAMSREEAAAIRDAIFKTMVVAKVSKFEQDKIYIDHIYDRRHLPTGVESSEVVWQPTWTGGDLVCRLDYAAAEVGPDALSKLGFSTAQERLFINALSASSGLILLSGITGSLKYATQHGLHAVLRKIRPELKIVDVQRYVAESGLDSRELEETGTFADLGTKALLDFGELRYDDLTGIALRSARQGALVLAQFHARTASAAVAGLALMARGGLPTADDGIEAALNHVIRSGDPHSRDVSALLMELAEQGGFRALCQQQSVRMLCPQCRKPLPDGSADIPAHMATSLGHITLKVGSRVTAGTGCDACELGYSGRTVIASVFVPDEDYVRRALKGPFADPPEFLQQWWETLAPRHAEEKLLAGTIDAAALG